MSKPSVPHEHSFNSHTTTKKRRQNMKQHLTSRIVAQNPVTGQIHDNIHSPLTPRSLAPATAATGVSFPVGHCCNWYNGGIPYILNHQTPQKGNSGSHSMPQTRR